MTQMKLPKQVDRRASDFTVSLSSDLRSALQTYADLYRTTYGEEIPLTELIPAILGEFLADDSAFNQKQGLVAKPARTNSREKENLPVAFAAKAVEKLIPLKDVCRLIGVGKSMVYKMVQQGRFPAPYKPSAGASRWNEREVLDWIANIGTQRRSNTSS